jgi:hypothetical protein
MFVDRYLAYRFRLIKCKSKTPPEELSKRYMHLLPSSVWATYTTLFLHRNRTTNQCFPRYQTIVDTRGLCRRTIIRAPEDDVTPRMTHASPLTQSSSKQRYTKAIQPTLEATEAPCNHPWGEPMGYPNEGFWRCSTCGDLYKR